MTKRVRLSQDKLTRSALATVTMRHYGDTEDTAMLKLHLAVTWLNEPTYINDTMMFEVFGKSQFDLVKLWARQRRGEGRVEVVNAANGEIIYTVEDTK